MAVDFFSWAIEHIRPSGCWGSSGTTAAVSTTPTSTQRGARGAAADRCAADRGGGRPRAQCRPSRAVEPPSSRAVRAPPSRRPPAIARIAFDDTSRDFLDNVELKRVLAEVKRRTGRTFDVLGFDACLMNMIEVAYQLKGTAQVVVGSEELEPGEGWPYHRVLETLSPPTRRSPVRARPASSISTWTRIATSSVTQSAFDLGTARRSRRPPIDVLAKA